MLYDNEDKKDKKDKNYKEKSFDNVILGNAASEVVDRYGSAVKEHFVAYSGVDNEAGKQLTKGLKDISQYKVNPENEYSNLKQQAGFSAEVKHVARKNAENIINKNGQRVVRTDDVGRVNDQLYDHVTYDEHGNIIEQSQMKFVGHDSSSALQKLASKDYQKYLDNDVPMDVPSEQYEGIKIEAEAKAKSCYEQAERLKQDGKFDIAEKKIEEAKKYEKISKNIRKSTVSSDESMEARVNPEVSTAKDIVKLGHRAGLEQAKMGAAIGGGISIIRNCVACFNGDKEPEDAIKDVALDTGKAAAVSYGTAFTGSVIKGAMQNSKNAMLQNVSKTSLPAMLVTTTLDVGKTFKRYFSGEIDGVQCFEELGEKGVGMMSSSMFAVAFQAAIPIPVVGALVGSMVGYAFSSAYYKEVLNVFKEAKLAHERRLRIEAECAEAIKMIREYRERLESIISEYLIDHITVFNDALNQMNTALELGDIDSFIEGNNKIINKLGKKSQFNSFKEIDDFMNSDIDTLTI